MHTCALRTGARTHTLRVGAGEMDLCGYEIGQGVYYAGDNQTWDDGDRLVYGQRGEVTGPATGPYTEGKGVKVRFPGNTGGIDCFLTSLSREHPGAHGARQTLGRAVLRRPTP